MLYFSWLFHFKLDRILLQDSINIKEKKYYLVSKITVLWKETVSGEQSPNQKCNLIINTGRSENNLARQAAWKENKRLNADAYDTCETIIEARSAKSLVPQDFLATCLACGGFDEKAQQKSMRCSYAHVIVSVKNRSLTF